MIVLHLVILNFWLFRNSGKKWHLYVHIDGALPIPFRKLAERFTIFKHWVINLYCLSFLFSLFYNVLWYIWNGKLAAVDLRHVQRPCLTVLKSKIKTFISHQVVSCWSLSNKNDQHNQFFYNGKTLKLPVVVTIMFNSYCCCLAQLPHYMLWNSWLAAEIISIITMALYHSAVSAYKWFNFCTYGGSGNSFLTKTEGQFIALVKACAVILLNLITLHNVNCSDKSACNLGECYVT